MNRIDKNTVEFDSPGEVEAVDLFEAYLDKGHGIPLAASLAMNRAIAQHALSPNNHPFIEYLSDGTCRRWGSRVLIKPEWRKP